MAIRNDVSEHITLGFVANHLFFTTEKFCCSMMCSIILPVVNPTDWIGTEFFIPQNLFPCSQAARTFVLQSFVLPTFLPRLKSFVKL